MQASATGIGVTRPLQLCLDGALLLRKAVGHKAMNIDGTITILAVVWLEPYIRMDIEAVSTHTRMVMMCSWNDTNHMVNIMLLERCVQAELGDPLVPVLRIGYPGQAWDRRCDATRKKIPRYHFYHS